MLLILPLLQAKSDGRAVGGIRLVRSCGILYARVNSGSIGFNWKESLSQRNENELEGFHENLHEKFDSKVATPRAFGLTFAAIFLAAGALLWFRHGRFPIWSFLVGSILLIVALALPGLLAPLNRVWSIVGSALHGVMTQILMGLVFVFAVTPVALLRKVFGGSGLALRFDPSLDSYWITRDHAVTDAESLKRQF